MKILHVAALGMNPSAGPTYSIPEFVKSQNKVDGVTSQLLITVGSENRKKEFFYLESFDNNDNLLKFLIEYNLVVFHSTYILQHAKIAKILRKKYIPYIIVPRGGFTRGAKDIKRYKKKIGDLLIFNRFFNKSTAIHFLTVNEQLESVHNTKNDFILPNGINIPGIEKKTFDNNKIKLIFIGRLDIYHKGLDLMINGIALIKEKLEKENVTVDMYGPDVRNSKIKLKKLIEANNLENIIRIKEPVFSEEKTRVLNDSHIFIQTSRFEGLPMGVLEALSLGLPCLLTPGTNISKQVSEFEGGLEVSQTPQGISNGILELINSKERLEVMGKNAIKVANEYSWDKIAEKSIEKYIEITTDFD